MKTAIDWFRGDGKGIVERWAYFGAFADMASGGNPNGLENPDGSVSLDLMRYHSRLTDRSTPWVNTTSLFKAAHWTRPLLAVCLPLSPKPSCELVSQI